VAERQYILQDGSLALSGYVAARLKLLSLLENLPKEDWQRISRHSLFGRTTLQELVSIMNAHDFQHIRQLEQSLSA
jgi:hypothetical protein